MSKKKPTKSEDRSSVVLSMKDKYACLEKDWGKLYPFYRLSDMVRHKEEREGWKGREAHYEFYPDSIASQYMRETDEDNNLSVLINLINKFPKDLTPQDDELVVHLRIGEVLEYGGHSASQFLEKKCNYTNGRNYVKPMSYYENLLELLPNLTNKDICKVVIVAGGCLPMLSEAHSRRGRTRLRVLQRRGRSAEGVLPEDFKRSMGYVQKIKGFFESSNFQVELRLGLLPDEDFVFMCRSKFFVPSGGGFSRLVEDLKRELR